MGLSSNIDNLLSKISLLLRQSVNRHSCICIKYVLSCQLHARVKLKYSGIEESGRDDDVFNLYDLLLLLTEAESSHQQQR